MWITGHTNVGLKRMFYLLKRTYHEFIAKAGDGINHFCARHLYLSRNSKLAIRIGAVLVLKLLEFVEESQILRKESQMGCPTDVDKKSLYYFFFFWLMHTDIVYCHAPKRVLISASQIIHQL